MIIVTIIDENNTFNIDLEVPVLKEIRLLLPDIIEILAHCNIRISKGVKIFVPRLQRIINTYETLGQAGVRNGDYLILCN